MDWYPAAASLKLGGAITLRDIAPRHLEARLTGNLLPDQRPSNPTHTIIMPSTKRKEEEEEELFDEEPPTVEPYTVLGLEKSATADEIKSAYRKAALKHHPGQFLFSRSPSLVCTSLDLGARKFEPLRALKAILTPSKDKSPEHLKEEAHTKFQEVAFAYAILSDPVRRKRYDVTGSTSESIDADGFSWSEYYSEQFRDVITTESVETFSKGYKGSDEEKDDLLNAYTNSKGKWSGIYETVMLSNPLEDEERFKAIIDEAIAGKDVEAYSAYTKETAKQRESRMKRARKEAEESESYAKELDEKVSGNKKSTIGKKKSGEGDLAALIQKKQAGRGDFFAHLEAKYGSEKPKSKSKSGKKGKKRVSDEDDEEDDGMPSEEAFQAAAAKLKLKSSESSGGRKSKRAKH